jgi:hypothetical protein
LRLVELRADRLIGGSFLIALSFGSMTRDDGLITLFDGLPLGFYCVSQCFLRFCELPAGRRGGLQFST